MAEAVAVARDGEKRAEYRNRAARYALRESHDLEELADVYDVLKAQGDALDQAGLAELYETCLVALDTEQVPF